MLRWFALATAAVLLVGGCSSAQPVAEPATPATPAASSEDDLKPFSEIVTEDAVSYEGLFDVHLEDDGLKLLYQIPDSLFGREMLIYDMDPETKKYYSVASNESGRHDVESAKGVNGGLLNCVIQS